MFRFVVILSLVFSQAAMSADLPATERISQDIELFPLLTQESATLDSIKKAVDAGASLEEFDSKGRTPLMLALTNDLDSEVIRFLLDGGSNPNAPAAPGTIFEGRTPLMFAAAHCSNPDILYLLTNAGANINAPCSRYKSSALHYSAAEGKHPSVVRTLVELGADLFAHNDSGLTPFAYGVRHGGIPPVLAAFLTLGVDVNGRKCGRYFADTPPLMHAAAAGSYETMHFLLEHGANPNALAHEGAYENMTPLMIVCQSSASFELCELLVDAGADINPSSKHMMAPLSYAVARNDNEKIFEFLLAKGADPNARNPDGLTQFMLACRFTKYPERLRAFLNYKADLFATDHRGWNAMHHAAMKNRFPETLAILANWNFDIDQPTPREGLTPLMIALRYGMRSGNIAKLIEMGADVNARDRGGRTPIMFAPMHGKESARLLIDAGADVNAQSLRGETALMVAVSNPVFDTADLLLDAGADPNLETEDGHSSIDIARMGPGRLNRALIKRLEKLAEP